MFLRCACLLPQHLKPHQKEGFQFIWNALEVDFRQVRGASAVLLLVGWLINTWLPVVDSAATVLSCLGMGAS